MTETAPRGAAAEIPPGWTARDMAARDMADREICHAVLPLLELADALGPLVELIAERLMARFGNSTMRGVMDADVANSWERVMGFAEYVQEMIEADRPHVLRGQCRLAHVHGSDHHAVMAAAMANDAPGETSAWIPAR